MKELMRKELGSLLHTWRVMHSNLIQATSAPGILWLRPARPQFLLGKSRWVPCHGCRPMQNWMKRSQLSCVLQDVSVWCQVITLHVWSTYVSEVSCVLLQAVSRTSNTSPPSTHTTSCMAGAASDGSGTPHSEVMLALTSADFAHGYLQYIIFATWRDSGTTEPWKAIQLTQLPQKVTKFAPSSHSCISAMKLTSIPTINPLIHEYEKLLIVASVHEKFHCICSCASKLPGTV